MKNSLAPRRAFTLIEILVVIAIIGILSAILFPVFSRARENGRAKACLSNMKQLGLAFQQYQQDSRGKYPLAANYQAWGDGAHWVSGKSGNGENLAAITEINGDFPYNEDTTNGPKQANVEKGALFPYVKSTAVYICPSNRDGQKKKLSYSMNCAVSGLSASRIRSPGDIVLLVDEEYATDGFFFAVNDGGNGGTNLAGSKGVGGADTNTTDLLTKEHNGGGNLLFADGHAKFYPFESFPLDSTDKGKANKWKTGGAPRFHDRGFGPFGSSVLSRAIPTKDACFATAGPGNADGTGNITP